MCAEFSFDLTFCVSVLEAMLCKLSTVCNANVFEWSVQACYLMQTDYIEYNAPLL